MNSFFTWNDWIVLSHLQAQKLQAFYVAQLIKNTLVLKLALFLQNSMLALVSSKFCLNSFYSGIMERNYLLSLNLSTINFASLDAWSKRIIYRYKSLHLQKIIENKTIALFLGMQFVKSIIYKISILWQV